MLPVVDLPENGRRGNQFALNLRILLALEITESELNKIAGAAITGLRKIPNSGYITPAAIGTLEEL